MITRNESSIKFMGKNPGMIMAGIKTMTHRVITPQPERQLIMNAAGSYRYTDSEGIDPRSPVWQCPYGKPGGILWVKEDYAKNPDNTGDLFQGTDLAAAEYFYRVDGPRNGIKWISASEMPRRAARILLEILSIRVKRLQDITTRDCIKEGYPVPKIEITPVISQAIKESPAPCLAAACLVDAPDGPSPKQWFSELWDSINGWAHPWSSNPWVWAIEFKVLSNKTERVQETERRALPS